MSYTILKQDAFDTLPYRLKVIRKKPPRDAKGVILVTFNLYEIGRAHV